MIDLITQPGLQFEMCTPITFLMAVLLEHQWEL